jgi:hypothetical protein
VLDREGREAHINRGVILTVSPLVSILFLFPLSFLFSRPTPWPFRGFVAIVLIAGLIVGLLGLQQINRGRSRAFDRLGLFALALQFGGVFLYWLFIGAAQLLYGIVFYDRLPFGGM